MLHLLHHEKSNYDAPPPNDPGDITIIHGVKKLYASIYQAGKKLPKSDKLGIHAHVEEVALSTMGDIIRAAFAPRTQKLPVLEGVRVSLEVLKHLVRTEHELHIIDEKTYLHTAELIVETSKMASGWIKYLTQNPAK